MINNTELSTSHNETVITISPPEETCRGNFPTSSGTCEGRYYVAIDFGDEIGNIKTQLEELSEKVQDSANRIQIIEKRNRRVESEKGFETSYSRRMIITGLTYFAAAGFLRLLASESPYFYALVPTGGYVISTLCGCQKAIRCWDTCFHSSRE